MRHSASTIALFVFVSSALALAGCGGRGVTPPFAGQVTHDSMLVSDVVEATVPNVAGTYKGTFTVTESGHSGNGTFSQVMKQSGTAISGTVAETILGSTKTFNFSGTVAKAAKGAKLKFTIYNQSSGRNASAHANVIGKHENGKAYVPPSGTKPAIYFTFKGLRQ
ncbi:MAG TPA: hypothetical protein VGZ02_17995 [Candidatus Baltobacteraceae bacterium]|jgi:hypothetical protein|nr:hypothetical protein [Candidatus Baltobacteraceae bacterium]